MKSRLSSSCWWFLRWSLKGGSSVFFSSWWKILHWCCRWHLTVFLTTGIDPSHSFRMTPCRPSSFWMGTRIPCKKGGKWDNDTEWRICYSDDAYHFPCHGYRFFAFVTDDDQRFPHYDSRSFAGDPDDVFHSLSLWRFPFPIVSDALSLNRHSERG